MESHGINVVINDIESNSFYSYNNNNNKKKS